MEPQSHIEKFLDRLADVIETASSIPLADSMDEEVRDPVTSSLTLIVYAVDAPTERQRDMYRTMALNLITEARQTWRFKQI